MADKKTKAKIQERGELSVADLTAELGLALVKRGKLKFQHNVAPIKNPMELRVLRRDIARIKTFIRSKEAAK